MHVASLMLQCKGAAAVNFVLYAIALAVAWKQGWSSADLVWSFWLGSLLIGYSSILWIIGSDFSNTDGLGQRGKFGKIEAKRIGNTLFMLAFFSVHFCAFHAGYAMFLDKLFEAPRFLEVQEIFVMNPLDILDFAVTQVLPVYAFFLIPVLGNHLVAKLKSFTKSSFGLQDEALEDQKNQRMGAAMRGPYLDVIRLHFVIILLGASEKFGLDHFGVYAVILAIFFFLPDFDAIKKHRNTWSFRDGF